MLPDGKWPWKILKVYAVARKKKKKCNPYSISHFFVFDPTRRVECEGEIERVEIDVSTRPYECVVKLPRVFTYKKNNHYQWQEDGCSFPTQQKRQDE